MKKILLLAVLFISITAFSQKKQHPKTEFTTEQKTQLIIKKMTIDLDLTPKQVAKITPIVVEKASKMEARKAEFKSKKGDHKSKRKILSSDDKFKMAMAHLEEQETLQNKMKNILDKEQYVTWKKMHKKHGEKRKQIAMKHGDKKKGDSRRERNHKHEEPKA
ncbi:hypothetical protein [Wenyingzhuangia sp. 2_MG-2023]|uniref:hypothetical protein n=1 Tax=Wenyingzhuangia sp. 2_MG-2023 TaxID=3062639 RepID=UPI0026E3400B|nr:hypothetical protein [Wenyingzhuangia sp. 2_MG-2023]MDO6736818.1 hypothetical protein [Wenyingzhuangia sp. 2_MG-2023]MDO6800886.1 hypothetical protein [Wenyingzhuangia sp. 1_MG-2023]